MMTVYTKNRLKQSLIFLSSYYRSLIIIIYILLSLMNEVGFRV